MEDRVFLSPSLFSAPISFSRSLPLLGQHSSLKLTLDPLSALNSLSVSHPSVSVSHANWKKKRRTKEERRNKERKRKLRK